MTTITDTSSAATLAQSSEPASSQDRFQEDYETFLTLLTTQLQNQNPLEPMDSNEFTQQIVSYSSLEQQINTNSSLDQMISLFSGFSATSALSFVGDSVTIDGASAQLSNGVARWDYSLSRNGANGSIEIRDRAGSVVRTDTAETTAGDHSYVWDGRDDRGREMEDGDYSISIVVQDASETAVSVSTAVTGIVEAVDLTGEEPLLVVNGQNVPLSAVQKVRPSN